MVSFARNVSRARLALASFAFVFLFPVLACAQGSAPSQPPTLSASVAVSMAISLVLGALAFWKQSGAEPATWVPVTTIVASFLTGAGGYFTGLGSGFVLNVTTIVYAIQAGILCIFSSGTVAFAHHAHVVLPAAARAMRKTAAGLVVLALGMATASTLSACSSSTWQSFLSQIESAVTSGQAVSSLEQIVDYFFPQYAGDAAIVASILDAAINLLEQTGEIPAGQAEPIRAQLKVQIDAAKKTGWVLPADAARVLAEIQAGRCGAFVAAVKGQVRL
jgi:hypothetical protein